MSDDRTAIRRQIDGLDHPDAHHQDAILDKFSRRVDEVRPVVIANFSLVNARIRRALLRWLAEYADAQVTLPLMRYVFDEATTMAEQTGRVMAMSILVKRARKPEGPEELGRLRAFAEDLCSDDNPEIRRLATTILAHVGTFDSVPYVDSLKNDADSEVRRAARLALDALKDAPRGPGKDDESWDSGQLTKALLNSAGPRRRQLSRRWRRHGQRAEIAVDILRNRGELRDEALRILLENPDSGARPFLAALVLEGPNSEVQILAMRVLSHLDDDGPLRADEERALRLALRSSDPLFRAAGIAVVTSFEKTDFHDELIRASCSDELSPAVEAARALDELLGPSDHELCPSLIDAIRTAERRRRAHTKERQRTLVVAHLLSALRKCSSPTTVAVESIHRLALDILAAGRHHKPLRVTAVDLLMKTTPEEGLGRFERWSQPRAATLLEVLHNGDEAAARRVGQLLLRAAPSGMAELFEAARILRRAGVVDLAEVVIPLLERAATDEAFELISELADDEVPATATAARQALRRRRNAGEYIDAKFIPDEPS